MKKEESIKNEESIKKLKDILEEATETDNSVCYVTSDDADVLKAAIQALEKESVLDKILDKIKAEIMEKDFDFGDYYDHTDSIIEIVCKVIDKYGQKPLIEANREQIDIGNSIDNERKEGEIELVIKIPEEMAYRFKHEGEQKHYDYHAVIKACINGTLLPKGHGDLIDVDKAKKDLVYTPISRTGNQFERYLDKQPPLIKADKEEKEADSKNKAKSATSYDSKVTDNNLDNDDYER